MDPIMRAARAFLDEVEGWWEDSPERVLPLVAEVANRGDVVKALRLGELAPESRRPLFVYEAPFTEVRAYFDGLTDAIERDYEAVRVGVADEGVTLPGFTMIPILLGPLERAALAMERAAALSGVRFDGVTVALLPAQIADGTAWRESVRALEGIARSPRVRLAVHAPSGGPLESALGDEGARFHVDPGELLGFLAEQDGEPSEGPATATAPAWAAAETATGLKLRRLMLEAAAKMAAQEPAAAAGVYEQACALGAAEGLVMEEASARMGLGGACLAAQAPHLAVENYSKAAGLAEGEQAWELASLAWLGVGGACAVRERCGPARMAYQAAASAARLGGVPTLEAEARRMADACGGPQVDGAAAPLASPRAPLAGANDTLVPRDIAIGPALPFGVASAVGSPILVECPTARAQAEDRYETAVLGAFVPGAALPFARTELADVDATMILPARGPG